MFLPGVHQQSIDPFFYIRYRCHSIRTTIWYYMVLPSTSSSSSSLSFCFNEFDRQQYPVGTKKKIFFLLLHSALRARVQRLYIANVPLLFVKTYVTGSKCMNTSPKMYEESHRGEVDCVPATVGVGV